MSIIKEEETYHPSGKVIKQGGIRVFFFFLIPFLYIYLVLFWGFSLNINSNSIAKVHTLLLQSLIYPFLGGPLLLHQLHYSVGPPSPTFTRMQKMIAIIYKFHVCSSTIYIYRMLFRIWCIMYNVFIKYHTYYSINFSLVNLPNFLLMFINCTTVNF